MDYTGIHTKKKNYERQFKKSVILYLHYFGKQKNFITHHTLETTKKPPKLVCQTIKGIINLKNKSDESISSLLIDSQLITIAKQISNHFNNFIISITEIINRNIIEAKKPSSFIS